MRVPSHRRSYTREDWQRAYRAVRRQRWGTVSCECHFIALAKYAQHITHESTEAMVERYSSVSLEQVKAERAKREYRHGSDRTKSPAVKKMISQIQQAYGPQIGALMQANVNGASSV